MVKRAAKSPKYVGNTKVESVTVLTVEQVLDIIDACKQAEVSRFSFCGLSLSFEKSLDDNPETIPQAELPRAAAAQRPPRRQTRPASLTQEELEAARARLAAVKAQEERAQAEAKLEAREYELERLKVEDPLAYERAIESGDIEI